MHITDFISDKMNSDDSKLLEELYSSEYQNLINYAGYILYNSDYVEDVVQETFAIAVQKIADLQSSNNQVGWLYRTLQNVVRNKNRDLQKPNKIISKITQSMFDQIFPTTAEFESNIHGLEEMDCCSTRPLEDKLEELAVEIQNRCYAWTALERLFAAGVLTEVQKRRFRLHVFRGLSTRQIGRLEGTSHQAVAKSLNLAIGKLKKFFAEQG
ncbi:RNA polymerase sigma factor [Flavonifractor plautii]|uniref:RNA polymerase sigma factor n=1 Tax=Flavonifractor plautii TaxID=292800 RepID=UPI00232E6A0B|nr:sigma-70 family RNA polymerase sigma factor [Flavonifractor plautii]MDB7957746.1 sigma-70 family RNA polymerase sigma factor [Flavonifractor plautii]